MIKLIAKKKQNPIVRVWKFTHNEVELVKPSSVCDKLVMEVILEEFNNRSNCYASMVFTIVHRTNVKYVGQKLQNS